MKGRSHRLQSHDLHEDWNDGSWTVDCVCGVTYDDGEEMVNCDECGVWVHTRCSRYVKGDELFTCDKCKSKNIKDDSEETEVAQLLVELPTKTIRLETSFAAPPAANGPGPTPAPAPSPTCRPLRLWTDIPMEERVHVQGIPGGDPALFSGLSSVFTPELWKCTGYVPKKFNFKYREFPCWDENSGGDGRNGDDNENAVDNGAGVLFSLAKESVLATPGAALIGMRDRGEDASCGRKHYSKDRKNWVNGDGEAKHSQIGVKKERSLLRPVVIHSSKRKKEDMVASKDRSGKKKARVAYKELDAKKRGSSVSKTALTSTSDAKPLEFHEDRGLKSIRHDSQSAKNKNLRDAIIQESDSDRHFSEGNGVEKVMNSISVIERSSEISSCDISRKDFSTGAELKAEKSSHEGPEVVGSPSKVGNLDASVPEYNDVWGLHAEQEGDNKPNGNLNENVEGSAGSDVKPPTEELASTILESKVYQINDDKKFESFTELNVQVDVDDDNSRGVLNCQSSVSDTKDTGASNDNAIENSKMSSVALSGSPSDDHKGKVVASEAVGDCHMEKQNELAGDTSLFKREVEGSEGSISLQKCFSEPKLGTMFAEELSKSGGTAVSSSSLTSQNKIVLCVGKLSSTSATVMISKSSANDNIRSPDNLDNNPNARQRVMSECNSTIKKDRAATDAVKVKDEDSQDISRKMMKERLKSSLNSSSKVSNSKVSHASVFKRIVSDSKDSAHHPSSKSSSAQDFSETSVLPQNECASHVQNKAPPSGLPVRGEKFNQSICQVSSKAHHAPSMDPPPSANLSDEELALLLHQQLNSSPRVPRVPRVRHTGSLPQLASPTATSMLLKRTSSSGGRDHSSFSRRKNKDSSKDVSRSHEPDVETKKTDRVPSSPEQRRQDTGFTADELSKREDNESSVVHSVKKSIPLASTSTANSGPSSSTEVNDHNLSSARDSPRNMSDEDTGTARGPVHRTLPGLINEIMSKGRRMTYEELCNAVLPHWHNLRKHNGERYAYSSPSQAVLDCLRNRHEWAQLVDRGPKTSSSRKRRKLDTEESEDNDYGKRRTSKEGEGKSLESQKEDVPKGKRKARKRRRLALQGRGIKEIRKRQKADIVTDDDSGQFSNSSEESLFSEEEIRGGGGTLGSEASAASSDETGTM